MKILKSSGPNLQKSLSLATKLKQVKTFNPVFYQDLAYKYPGAVQFHKFEMHQFKSPKFVNVENVQQIDLSQFEYNFDELSHQDKFFVLQHYGAMLGTAENMIADLQIRYGDSDSNFAQLQEKMNLAINSKDYQKFDEYYQDLWSIVKADSQKQISADFEKTLEILEAVKSSSMVTCAMINNEELLEEMAAFNKFLFEALQGNYYGSFKGIPPAICRKIVTLSTTLKVNEAAKLLESIEESLNQIPKDEDAMEVLSSNPKSKKVIGKTKKAFEVLRDEGPGNIEVSKELPTIKKEEVPLEEQSGLFGSMYNGVSNFVTSIFYSGLDSTTTKNIGLLAYNLRGMAKAIVSPATSVTGLLKAPGLILWAVKQVRSVHQLGGIEPYHEMLKKELQKARILLGSIRGKLSRGNLNAEELKLLGDEIKELINTTFPAITKLMAAIALLIALVVANEILEAYDDALAKAAKVFEDIEAKMKGLSEKETTSKKELAAIEEDAKAVSGSIAKNRESVGWVTELVEAAQNYFDINSQRQIDLEKLTTGLKSAESKANELKEELVLIAEKKGKVSKEEEKWKELNKALHPLDSLGEILTEIKELETTKLFERAKALKKACNDVGLRPTFEKMGKQAADIEEVLRKI